MTTASGATAFLQQAHRNNWQRYLASLQPGTRRGWDVCVLTASDERQADMYRRQLDWRRAAGLLPHGTQFLVLPDPPGQRIGSGGATLRALAHIADCGLRIADCTSEKPASSFQQPAPRYLIIHSGGDSKRLPHCSVVGKLFARVPRVLPDGRASTIFDEFLISLSGLADGAPGGVLVASGDVLLIFDHLQLSFQRGGVIGVAAAAPAEMGARHGVYASGDGGQRVLAYLHKPAAAELARWSAVAADETVQIDTGLVWLDTAMVQRLVALAQEPSIVGASLNLYGDLLLPLAESTALQAYLADTSDGPATPDVQGARRTIWECLRGAAFGVQRLQPAVFVHFGSSREYWRMVAGDTGLAQLCGWQPATASWQPTPPNDTFPNSVLINALVNAPLSSAGDATGARWDGGSPLIVDSHLSGSTSFAGPAIIAGVRTDQPLVLAAGVVLDQWPVFAGHFVTRLFGLLDDPKRNYNDSKATFVNRPWADWLAAAGVTEEPLWPHVPAGQRTLWNAQLFPALADREASLALALPLQDPAAAGLDWRTRWTQAPRLSLAESFAVSDGDLLLEEIAELEHTISARRFVAACMAEVPARDGAPLLGAHAEAQHRRAALAAALIAGADPVFRLRAYKALTVATGDPAWEDRAFATCAEMIAGAGSRGQGTGGREQLPEVGYPPSASRHRLATICVRAAARIDFGGGWTDTPPYSIERGGTVLNAAITLRGEHPIIAEAAPLPDIRLIFESRDIGAVLEPRTAGEILAYANPADPFALHKAALVLRGIVPADSDPAAPLADVLRPLGSGLRLSTATTIPRGSGLGTSSILAGAVLAALFELTSRDAEEQRDRGAEEQRGRGAEALMAVAVSDLLRASAPPRLRTSAQLFDEVLCLEQMLTTGGGWQDQVGGLTGGIKLVTTEPGLPQRIQVEPIMLAPATAAALTDRLVMVYTGQQRLAKDLLRAVMGRWMARDPEMVWIQAEIARLALAMRAALQAGDLDGFGGLLGEHWTLNKRMDPGCTNPFIDELFRVMAPYINGGKLAGAGGGGFVSAIARDRAAVADLSATLARHYPGTPVGIWPCGVPEVGLWVDDTGMRRHGDTGMRRHGDTGMGR